MLQNARKFSSSSSILFRRPLKDHTRTLIWLHGLGQSTQGLIPLLEMCCPPTCKLIVPIAPMRSIDSRKGRDFSAWYNIAAENPELDIEDNDGFDGLHESRKLIEKIIDQERGVIDSKEIILAGFQQGGAMAVHVGLKYKFPLKAICTFNGYVLPHDTNACLENKDTLVFAMNAEDDESIDIKYAENCFERIKKFHQNVQFQVDFSNTGKGKMISHEAIQSLASIVLSS
jgi:phospholipase/carboxylesterase